jgi:homoserine O-acetyltransferase
VSLSPADLIVEKKIFEMPSLTISSGGVISPVRVGWESYGTLNADKSNAILIAHYFSGTSHAAGKYAQDDILPGYWDDLIGPGKPVDTDRYFVLSSDTLINLNARDPHVVTTGPASVDPATGQPYGPRFPLVTIRDFVEVQKALVDSLGITKLHAVMGPSMGGLQTYEWASAYPDMMTRIVPVISAGAAHPWLIAWLDAWATPIRLDPKWQQGLYDPADPPLAGLTESLKLVTLQALHWDWAEAQFGRAWAQEGADPLAALDNRYKVQAGLREAAAARAGVSDANHFLYLVKANQSFAADLTRIKVPALVLYAPNDQVFPADWVRATAETIRAGGARVEVAEIPGPLGHLNGIAGLAPLGPKIRDFLNA